MTPESSSETAHREGGPELVVRRAKGLDRILVQLLGLGQPALLLERIGELREDRSPGRRLCRKLEDSSIRRLRRGHVEVHRAVAGECQEAPEPALQIYVSMHTRRATQRERLLVVVHEDVRMVGDALGRLSLDPGSCTHVLRRSCRAWNLLVRDIANEHVPERELLLVSHGRDPGRPDELASHEIAHARKHVLT